jgi:hypothetical protein
MPSADAEWGSWGIGAAHYEVAVGPPNWHQVQSWNMGRERVQQSFREWDNGPVFWWVGDTWSFGCNNAGNWQGVYSDGNCWALEVNY